MGWESRETSKHRYLLRCEFRGGRGIRRYVGPQRDALVRVLARSDGLTLAQRQAIRMANVEEQDRYLDAEFGQADAAPGIVDDHVMLSPSVYSASRVNFRG